MLEFLFGAGGADLIRDEWRILFTGWTESELRFLWIFLLLMTAPLARRLW
jgi:hypothetical protein